jgi:hypothetical protein
MAGKSADLAVIGASPLSDAETERQIRELRKARDYVRRCPESEALKAKQDSALVREWVKIHKASSKIAVEACKLQATAVRRLCQLGSHAVTGREREAGDWLASLSDGDFDELIAGMRYARSPVTMYSDYCRIKRQDDKIARGRDLAGGEGEGARYDYESVSKAASELLHSSLASGATTVWELSEQLLRAMDFNWRERDDYLLREGAEEVIREALRHDTWDGGGHPEFITWNEKEVGWLRIPWPAATLDQIRWMADFRQQQAKDLQAAANDLSELADALEQVSRAHPDLRRLPELWHVLKADAEEESAA